MKEKALEELLQYNCTTEKEMMKAKRKIAKKFGLPIFENSVVLKYYLSRVKKGDIKNDPDFARLLRKRAIRTMSGIAPVAVLTKPYECPGNCAFCPTEKDVPQSYLSNEPAVMRAIRCGYNPYIQVQDRLKALIANGHEPTKIELIVIGGTWSYFPRKYKYWYIVNLFKAANDFRENKFTQQKKYSTAQIAKENQVPLSTSLKELEILLQKEQKRNEKAKYNIIGLTLETRPDYINDNELKEMRELGCTRVELGAQIIDDEVLAKNTRGHGVKEIVDASALLKQYGFKVTYHLMPGLPGSNYKKDVETFKQLFTDERFQPDQIKFYPCVVTKGSVMYKWWQDGDYIPYEAEELTRLIIECKKHVPEYVRIIRLIRDIPGESIVAGNKVTNLRQVVQQSGVECKCIRCREAKGKKLKLSDLDLRVEKYKSSGGIEHFISYNSKDNKTLFGFCRLYIKSGLAIVRELHVYGQLVSIGEEKKIQHAGLGKKLLKKAESIAENSKCDKVKVISGVGVRGYYRKQGYRLQNTYMTKHIG